MMTGVVFSHLRRRRHRPDAAVVVRGREDLSRSGVRRRVSASRDALVQLHLVRRELTLRPRVVAPVELKHPALEPPRFARFQPNVALHPGSNLEPGHLKFDTLVLLYPHTHALQDARDLLELRVVLQAQLREANQIADLGGQGGEVVTGEVDRGDASKLPDDWRDAAGEFHLLKVELAHVSARNRDTPPLHRRLGINPELFQRGPVISQRLQHLEIVRVATDVAGLVDDYARTLPLEEQNRLRQARKSSVIREVHLFERFQVAELHGNVADIVVGQVEKLERRELSKFLRDSRQFVALQVESLESVGDPCDGGGHRD